MSAASSMLAAGLNTLIGFSGDALTLRRAGTTTESIAGALINRPEGYAMNKNPGFPAGDSTIIQFPSSAVTAAPKQGESFVDSTHRYRIRREPKLIDTWYHCECEASVL
jgi:hypothetical protein